MARYTSTHHKNRIMFNLALVAFLAVGAVIGLNLVMNPKALQFTGAWDCGLYMFNVSPQGQVTVINKSSRSEPSQTADVFINNTKVATVNVPALAAYGVTPTVVGTVTVPANGVFSWKVDGVSDCLNTGQYDQASVCNYVEIKVGSTSTTSGKLPGIFSWYTSVSNPNAPVNRIESQIALNWGQGSPDPAITVDNFYGDWVGYIKAPATGTYYFYAKSDDQFTFRLGGANQNFAPDTPILATTTPSTEVKSAAVSMTAGSYYFFKAHLVEKSSLAFATLSWEGPSIPKQTVPASAFSYDPAYR